MANIYVTGPCHIYVGFGTGTSGVFDPSVVPLKADSKIFYLGTAEQAPVPNFTRAWEDVNNDIAGVAFPFERTFQGEEANTNFTLSKWNEAVYQRLASGAIANSSTPGLDGVQERGTALHFEGGSFHTWLHFPYVAKAYGPTYGMKNGYHFFSSRVVGQGPQPGTKAFKRSLALAFASVYKASDCTWLLYDQAGTSWADIPAAPCSISATTGLVV